VIVAQSATLALIHVQSRPFSGLRIESVDMQMGSSGGLVEIDDRGQVIRAASSADPKFPDALSMQSTGVLTVDEAL
jgi:hypothetical protein